VATTETARVPEDISGRPRRMPVGGVSWRHTFRALPGIAIIDSFLGTTRFAHWHMDAADRDELVRISNHELEVAVGRRRRRRICSDDVVFIWGGSLADRYAKRSILVTTQTAQMICAFLLAVGAWAGFATAVVISSSRA